MKQGWEIKKLPDVVWFQEGPGVRKHQYTTSGIKLLNVANLVNGQINLSTSDRYISEEEAYGRYKHFLADEGDLILASSGIQVEYIEKKMGFVRKEHLPLCMNTSTIRFKSIDTERLHISFFMYFLKSDYFKLQLYKLITGIAQLNFGPLHLKQILIPVPPLPVQEQIVSELDLLSGIIEKKREQLKELDALAQSIFYDMFGDPITNEKGWEVKKLGEVCKTTSGGTPSKGQSNYYDGGTIPWLRSGEVNKMYIYDTELFITEEGLENSSAKWFPEDTVVIAMYGATVGQVGILRKRMTTNQAICGILPNETFIPIYLFHFLQSNKEEYIKMASGGAQPNISQNIIRDTTIITPPLPLQHQFASKIEAIERQKELIKQSISETEILFNERMQHYFG